MDIKSLFTRQAAETGRKMEVTTVDGKPTGLFITVRGTESTEFIQARREYFRRQAISRIDPDADGAALTSEHEYATLTASLIIDWDFADECTDENKFDMMYNCPYLAAMIDNFAAQCNVPEDVKKTSSTGQKKASN